MKKNDPSYIGQANVRQITIGSDVKIEGLVKIFLEKKTLLEKLLKKTNDKYANILISNLIKNKNFLFPLNTHVEKYILKNQNNFELIFNYIIFRYKFFIAGTDKINLGYPPYVLIEPVSACNLRCPFCFQVDKSFTKKPFMGVMKFDLFKKIIDEVDNLEVGAITLASRGEPLMHKELIKMLEYMNTKKNIYEKKINSNATFLSEDICHAIFKNQINQVVISSDHYIKKDYERLRVGSKFEEVVKNVDLLFNIRKKYYPKSITEIRISGIDNEKKLDRNKFKDFWIKRSDHVTASYPLERWDTYNNAIHEDINDPCEKLWDRMYIWFDGKVNPCDADYKSYLSFGNISNSSIKEVWNDKLILNLRNDHLNKKRKNHNPCNKCGTTYN